MHSTTFSNLETTFEKIGAKVSIIFVGDRQQFVPARLNIITKRGIEQFEIAIHREAANRLDLCVLQVLPRERHLVLLAKQWDSDGAVVSKNHFLCGHEERHYFVATVQSVTTVADAMQSLKPEEIRINETGLNTKKRNRRKTKAFKRQGEWFFIPSDLNPMPSLVLKEEPLIRGRGSKPHTAQFAYRTGGESVAVCYKYPNGLTERDYEELIARDPSAKRLSWRHMKRNPTVYVRGRIKHDDHATIALDSWHRVRINTELRSDSVGFLD